MDPSTARTRSAALVLGAALLLGGCADGSPAEPDGGVDPADPVAGRQLFEDACASCHLRSGGFDLALFDFPAADVVRRATDHVDEDEGRAIAAYLATLSVARVDPDHRLFQPGGGELAESDAAFWESVFGAEGIPAGFTPADLRAVDPRTLAAPFRLLAWSDEVGESDWMPERPLAPELLEAGDGRLGTALGAYFALPDTPRLLEAVDAFRDAAAAPGAMCAGFRIAVDRPLDCFEARRWMAALTALHLVREGGEPPEDVLRLWWEVGEAGVSIRFAHDPPRSELHHFERSSLLWLYLSWQYAPDLFPSDAGYLGQFSQSDFPRFSTFTQLRRMVHEGRLEAEAPWKPFDDALGALVRVPEPLADEVAIWAFRYLRDRLEDGMVLAGDDLVRAREAWDHVALWYDFAAADTEPAVGEARALWEEVGSRLDALGGG